MKILAQDNVFEIRGFKSFFERLGHKWISWDEGHSAAFDVFYEVKPDIYIGIYPHSKAVRKCLLKYPKIKVVEVPDYYTYSVKLDEGCCMNFAYDYLVDDNMWYKVEASSKFSCDIAYVDNVPSREVLDFNIKVFGKYMVHIPQYLGLCSIAEEREIYSSAKLVYVSDKQGESRAMGCGALCISDSFEDENVLPFESEEDVRNILDKLETFQLPNWRENTYYNRASEIFGDLV